ncbi:hypothetical protein RvY_10023 [Ramazzottius varieornatus]|uniref:G-protein coupled receptors family 2 profile 2 domain-containing protein n=1 Tax=Ramazzottius varieornatus TaxID=947166 RepID=A0A1D1VJ63_RAMVA|nr:hypothetical protein RvY_10023 [Ramazzottius varieornatus]
MTPASSCGSLRFAGFFFILIFPSTAENPASAGIISDGKRGILLPAPLNLTVIPLARIALQNNIPSELSHKSSWLPRRVRNVHTAAVVMIPPQPWALGTPESCTAFLESIGQALGQPGWCPGVTDEVLCWPAAPPGETIQQLCPRMQGVDPTKYAMKTCEIDGQWSRQTEGNPAGYTDYEGCYTEETRVMLDTFIGNSNDTTERFAVLIKSRAIEMAGYPLSLVCVLVSLFIFRYFRSLRNSRTTIHVHLFCTIAVMTFCKTIEISDQYISGYVTSSNTRDTGSLRTTRHLCEMLIVLIEYARTAMFMWMFLEGLYMHNVVAWKVFQASKPNYWLYSAIGWGFPALLVAAWAPVIEFVWLHERFVKRNRTNEDNCWYQHNESNFYNIIEIPRLCFIAINIIFLFNIIRVLLTKLRDSHQSDTVQIRKAVKATIVLAPLMGVTHLIWAIPPPTDFNSPFAWFAAWMYVSHFLRSFEGFFVALIYCFLNSEVQEALKTACQRQALQRETIRSANRRVSSLSSSHLTRYMQVNRDSVQSSVGNRDTARDRFFKVFPCWPSVRNGGASSANVRTKRHSQIPADCHTCSSNVQFPLNGVIIEEKEENIEM